MELRSGFRETWYGKGTVQVHRDRCGGPAQKTSLLHEKHASRYKCAGVNDNDDDDDDDDYDDDKDDDDEDDDDDGDDDDDDDEKFHGLEAI